MAHREKEENLIALVLNLQTEPHKLMEKFCEGLENLSNTDNLITYQIN